MLDSVELSADHAGRADFVVFRKVRFGLVLKLLFPYSRLYGSQSAPSTASPTTSNPTLSPNGISVISTIAGTGSASYSGDNGQATDATINGPAGIAIDSSGNLYFSDYGNHRVRRITVATGMITTHAGTGVSSYSCLLYTSPSPRDS